jgi:predicted nuclease of predicted toxin-antitoxin system
VRFLIDAQLPRRLAYPFREAGYDATRTLDLPNENRTADGEIAAIADRENQVVITKDADFEIAHVLHGQQKRLLVVKLGAIKNAELEAVLLPQLGRIERRFGAGALVEVTWTALVARG